MLDETLTLILAGGAGRRLHPLTAERAKPAVPFGGKYRIIDFTLTNCLHSGLRRILVLTQYKSHSLNKHLRDGWSIFNPELGEYVTPVPAQMRLDESWYLGTADAVHQNLYLLERSGARWVVILSGDHIYRMDYAPMLHFHAERGADATVACMQVARSEASAFGILSLDAGERVSAFAEKPEQPDTVPGNPEASLASMGIYVFSRDALLEVLLTDHQDAASSHDFGKDVIPRLVAQSRVSGYRFGGETGRVSPDRYWRDVGTLDSYFDANMDLLKPLPPMNVYQRDWPIRTYAGQYPPARNAPGEHGSEGVSVNSMIASGVVIAGGRVEGSILFNNVRVQEDAGVRESILLEGVSVGAGCRLRRCIVDKYVEIPPGESIGHDEALDRQRFTVSTNGVVVVPRGYRFA